MPVRPEHHTAMFREAAETPQRIAEQMVANHALMCELAAELRARAPRAVVTCARGSSDHAATYAKYLIETGLGLITASAAPSVASVYAAQPQMQDTLFLAISQSGRSPDLIAGARAAKTGGAHVVALVNHTDSPLAAAADRVIPLHAGPELSVAATKSCIAAFAAIAQLYAHWHQDAALLAALDTLPAALAQAWELDWSAARAPLIAGRDLYVVGRGLGFAAAQETALKLKETSALHAEAISAAELRHGPMALVEAGFPVLVLSQNDRTRPGIVELCENLSSQGAALFVAGFAPSQGQALPTIAGHAALEPLAMLMSAYRLANGVALARGFDPDRPPNLRKVTETV